MHKCEEKPDGISHYYHYYDKEINKYRNICHYCKKEINIGEDEDDAQRPDNRDT